MKQAPGNLKWAVAAIPLLALSLALAMPARQPVEPSPAPDNSVRHCESYPYTVDCARNQTPGGPIGCFDTLCDAVAAGAYQCKRLQGACEPRP
jgi:hypothetical protein